MKRPHHWGAKFAWHSLSLAGPFERVCFMYLFVCLCDYVCVCVCLFVCVCGVFLCVFLCPFLCLWRSLSAWRPLYCLGISVCPIGLNSESVDVPFYSMGPVIRLWQWRLAYRGIRPSNVQGVGFFFEILAIGPYSNVPIVGGGGLLMRRVGKLDFL